MRFNIIYEWLIEINLYISLTAVDLLPLANGERRCSEDKELHECVYDCRVALIISLCGCVPLTLPSTSSDSHRSRAKLCTFEQYARCLNYSGNEDSRCMSQCFPK